MHVEFRAVQNPLYQQGSFLSRKPRYREERGVVDPAPEEAEAREPGRVQLPEGLRGAVAAERVERLEADAAAAEPKEANEKKNGTTSSMRLMFGKL